MALGSQTHLDLKLAAEALSHYRRCCLADGGALWGVSLFGPVLLIDPSTQTAFLNQRVENCDPTAAEDVYRMDLPAELLQANTSFEWNGSRWAFVCGPLPSDREERLSLLVHESFHRVQPELGLHARAPVLSHLDAMRPRVMLRIELRALADALRAGSEEEMQDALRDALAARLQRRTESEEASAEEDDLEISEGLAEYTGRKLGHQDSRQAVACILDAVGSETSFARSLAYFTGPAYGLDPLDAVLGCF